MVANYAFSEGNMIRTIAVCDDEQDVTRQISAYLKEIENDTEDEFHVFYYSSAEELLSDFPRDTQIVFLDIQMGEMTGMDAARCLRTRGCEAEIIFITNMTEYALEGYEVHAFAFLRKPVQFAALKRNLLEILKKIDRESIAYITVTFGTSIQVVKLKDLQYVEVLGHDSCFVMGSGKQTAKIPLSEIEKETQSQRFFRCHKSFLINLRHITRIDPESVTMTNGDVIPVSKYRKKDLLKAYSQINGALR